MKLLSKIYKEQGLDFTFPIEIKDSNGNQTYLEADDGYWHKREYDSKGNETYYEDSKGSWYRFEYDANGKQTYFEADGGSWIRREYDSKGNRTYYEDSKGIKLGTPRSKSCDGKVVEIDGKKYELKLTK